MVFKSECLCHAEAVLPLDKANSDDVGVKRPGGDSGVAIVEQRHVPKTQRRAPMVFNGDWQALPKDTFFVEEPISFCSARKEQWVVKLSLARKRWRCVGQGRCAL